MQIQNTWIKIFTFTVFPLRVTTDLMVLDTRLLTCLSLVWKWPNAVYSCVASAQVVSMATVQYQMQNSGKL